MADLHDGRGHMKAVLRTRALSASLLTLAAAGVPNAARAQDAPSKSAPASPQNPAGDQAAPDIVVTGLKREQALQKVPAAISAIGSDSIQRQGITDTTNLQFYVPSLVSGKLAGVTAISIRGVGINQYGPTAQPGVAVHIDGVYQARTLTGGLGQIDLERVEVLRGPQGTLYGRNATGGAVNFITTDPKDTFSASFLAGYASYNEYHVQGILNAPLTEGLRARLAIDYVDRNDGFIKNVRPGGPDADKGSTFNARLKVAADITSGLELVVSGYFSRREGAYPYLLLNSPPGPLAVATFPTLAMAVVPSQPRRSSADLGASSTLDTYGGTATSSLSLGSIKLKSITAYSRYKYRDAYDSDGTNLSFVTLNERVQSKTFSQELNLSGSIGPVDFLVGAFYMDDDLDESAVFGFPIGYPLAGVVPGGSLTTRSRPYRVRTIAGFTDDTINITDKFRVILGARYTSDRVAVREASVIDGLQVAPGVILPPTDFCSGGIVEPRFHAFSPKAGLQYDIAERVSAYATFSRGFKDGGVNGCNTIYQPEKITAYEAGVRARLLGGKLTLNPTIFHYDYTDFQVTQFQGLSSPVVNAPKATVTGLEIESALTLGAHVRINANGTLLDAKYGDGFFNTDTLNFGAGVQDLSGKRLNRSPKRSGSIGLEYRTSMTGYGRFSLRGDLYASSRIYFREFNAPLDSQGSYSVVNLNLIWDSPDERLRARLYVTNLGNSAYLAQLGASDAYGARFVAYAPPRQVGVELKANF